MHHSTKRDAPSGTAKTLEANLAYRQGKVSIHSIRAGDVIGEHIVLFDRPGELIELAHKATDRNIFANGALQVAHSIIAQKPGYYSILDFLNLKD